MRSRAVTRRLDRSEAEIDDRPAARAGARNEIRKMCPAPGPDEPDEDRLRRGNRVADAVANARRWSRSTGGCAWCHSEA